MSIEEKRAARAGKVEAHRAMVKAINESAEEALYDAEDVFGIGRAKIVRGDSDESMCACVLVITVPEDPAIVARYRDKMQSDKTGPQGKRQEQDKVAEAAVFFPTKARPCKVDGAAPDYATLVSKFPGLPVSVCVETLKLAGILDAEDVGK